MKITGKLTTDTTRPAPKPVTQPPSRAARMLALAYLIERKIDAGEIPNYAAAARLLGISRARVSQVMRLWDLPIATQETILTGQLRVSERAFRSEKTRLSNLYNSP
jgi:hypothetical protein